MRIPTTVTHRRPTALAAPVVLCPENRCSNSLMRASAKRNGWIVKETCATTNTPTIKMRAATSKIGPAIDPIERSSVVLPRHHARTRTLLFGRPRVRDAHNNEEWAGYEGQCSKERIDEMPIKRVPAKKRKDR